MAIIKSNKRDRSRKNKKFKIILTFSILFILCQEALYIYNVRQIGEMKYTKYKLDVDDLIILDDYYSLTLEGMMYDDRYYQLSMWSFDYEYKYDRNKETCTLVPTRKETTQSYVEYYNYLISQSEPLQNFVDQFGITQDNAMTIEWVLENPHAAIEIITYILEPLSDSDRDKIKQEGFSYIEGEDY